MKHRVIIFLLVFLSYPLVVSADYLEVRRNANIYEKPSRYSKIIAKVKLDDSENPYLLRLATDAKVNGYYKVHVRGSAQEGWIYKTLVRRFNGQHPDYQPYRRSLYQHWIDEDGDCQNTRAEVLIRDDDDQVVKFKSEKECVVTAGTWLDPYTSETFHKASQVDVDHVVPLKNAHESGAWTWSKERRREYANYLRYNNHLLTVKASENRRKGSKGPDQYMPPLESYHCEYVQIWMKIKQDWELEMTEAEGAAVQRILDSCP